MIQALGERKERAIGEQTMNTDVLIIGGGCGRLDTAGVEVVISCTSLSSGLAQMMPQLLSLASDHPDFDVTSERLEQWKGATRGQHAHVPLFIPFLLPLRLPESNTLRSMGGAAMTEERLFRPALPCASLRNPPPQRKDT
jgi:hypothetical protein